MSFFVKATIKKYQAFFFALLFAMLLLLNKSFGQTATITFDYTGASFTCGTDPNYTPSSASITLPTTGIPAGATITGISFTASYGSAVGSTTFTFTLNGTSIGTLSANGTTCATGTLSPISIPLFNKTGPNTLAVSFSGVLSGVSNGVFTVAYTNCTATITASATKSDVKCFNTSTGQIIVSGSGGTAPYTYSIHNGGATYQSGNTFNNLPVGTYQIKVKDTNGCESKAVQ